MDFLSSSVSHLMQFIFNPIVFFSLLIIIMGEKLPFNSYFLPKIERIFIILGEYFNKFELKLFTIKKTDNIKIEKKDKVRNILGRVLLFSIAAIITLFLEIFWELGFKRLTHLFNKSSFITKFKVYIDTLDNQKIFYLFITPFVLMELIGTFAIVALIEQMFILGISLYVFKFSLFLPIKFLLDTKFNELMTNSWFKNRYFVITRLKKWATSTITYCKTKYVIDKVKSYINNIFKDISDLVRHLKKKI
jgi:hypothetical protein